MRSERTHAARQGRAAEQAACDYLLKRGLSLHSRNYRCRGGELDLIMEEGSTLVFIEVRFRSSSRFGGAAASVDASKQQKLVRAAQTFLGEYRMTNRPCRFDVITVTPQNGELELEWIQNAITAD